ncbi:MAG: precorrin-2 dehydrogenase/sirohydrochlorin ferrochelatase family protein [Acidimicrobiales bacterium]
MTKSVRYSGRVALLYPVSIDVADRPVLVVGGGAVASRKVASLVECGARLTVVAPTVTKAIDELEARGVLVAERRPYRRGEVSAYRLVVTATGHPDVDGQVATDAESAGVWVNAADDVRHCSVQLPAIHREGPVTIAVSTGGESPALARWLRDRLADVAGANLGVLATLLGASRTRLHASGRRLETARWLALLEGPLPALVEAGDFGAARHLLDAALGTGEAGPTAVRQVHPTSRSERR